MGFMSNSPTKGDQRHVEGCKMHRTTLNHLSSLMDSKKNLGVS